MASIHLRPRFRTVVPIPMQELTDKLRAELEKENAPFTGKVLSEFVVLRILPKDQHYWSPELTLQLHKENEGTLIRGLFGPHPAVWTMFAAFYIFAIFLSLIALLYGLSQWSLDLEPYGLWLLPIPIVLMIGAYITAFIGQRLGHDQMELLHHFLDRTLETETAPQQ
jgi:hypothetical protein